MLSIFVILAGIVLIIFIQFDRGYINLRSESDYHQQQKNLIDHVYQTEVDPQTTEETPLVMKLNKATVVIQTEPVIEAIPAPVEALQNKPVAVAEPQISVAKFEPEVIHTPAPQAAPTRQTNSDVWQQRQIEEDYQMRLLHNNPWSPHFKAGY